MNAGCSDAASIASRVRTCFRLALNGEKSQRMAFSTSAVRIGMPATLGEVNMRGSALRIVFLARWSLPYISTIARTRRSSALIAASGSVSCFLGPPSGRAGSVLHGCRQRF